MGWKDVSTISRCLMCNIHCIDFVKNHLRKEEVENKSILDVGSRNVNGTTRNEFYRFNPFEYIGIDIENGGNVDRICNVYDVVKEFGENRFDVVVSTEMVEHVEDWILAISNMKRVLKENGYIYLTTRNNKASKHDYPSDY